MLWVDYAKGIGIFLVAVGHVLRGLINSSIIPNSPTLEFIDHWIYAFHMPLFFFISGLFVQRSLSKPFKTFILDKVYVIAYPYFVWSIFQSILQYIASNYTNSDLSLTDIWKIVYQPQMQFWFLYTLFVIMLLYGVLYKLKVTPAVFFAISVGVYCLHVLDVSFGPWGILYLARRYALYLALGIIIGKYIDHHDLLAAKNRLSHLILWSIALGGYLALGIATSFRMTENIATVPLVAAVGILASVVLANILANLSILPFLSRWGTLSLEIFVAHSIFASVLRIILSKGFGLNEPIAHIVLGVAISIYAPIALNDICQKLNFQYLFTLRQLKAR
ncbi:acyltransferase [Mastigocoleus testarum BC008]|uniref:Acyltransferase n=1 Tax=Mastigocoleus testarum BC008 TaxID=371196 RepID=A0A0V7ZLB9_9CYAN|nr:acyltransferase [Mastigocoleus testarum BC008]KST68952.1 acyltransferase [Mastigocoleus testarum BC008]